MEDLELVITAGARKNLGNMRDRVNRIEMVFGEGSPEHVRALKTYMHVLDGITVWGGRVYGEDDLSLIIGSTITIGCIWSADRKVRDGFPVEYVGIAGAWSLHS